MQQVLTTLNHILEQFFNGSFTHETIRVCFGGNGPQGALPTGVCLSSPYAIFQCGPASMTVELPSLRGITGVLEADLLTSVEIMRTRLVYSVAQSCWEK